MIKIENVEMVGFMPAIRGMRNPLNSWARSDSSFRTWSGDYIYLNGEPSGVVIDSDECGPDAVFGEKDLNLMKKLVHGGSTHAKFRRMLVVYLDITAPLYWWKEFDTYKVGTVANSCSTMHKIADKEFVWDDFSWEHLGVHVSDEDGEDNYLNLWVDKTAKVILEGLNQARNMYLREDDPKIKKQFWWQMIQLLPSSYNQKRTVMLNYEVLAGMYEQRKDHKLDEWRDLCKWIEGLPYAKDLIL